MTTAEMAECGEGLDELSESTSVALFAGDEGGLSLAERNCLLYLLKNRYLSRFLRPDVWDVLMEDQMLMRSRLNDLFLTLHIDFEGEVAYKRQAVPDSRTARFPTLLHDTTYTREETVLLVYLRERMQRERAGGADSVLIDKEDLLERIAEFRRPDETDLAGEERRAEKAIESLKSMGVLHDTREDDRLTISPVLDSLMPLARLQELLEWLRIESDGEPPQQSEVVDVHRSGTEWGGDR